MALSQFENELHQVIESRFGSLAQTMPLIIIDQYRRLLDYLYTFLVDPVNKILIDRNSNPSVAFLKSKDEGSIKLRLGESELHFLNNLQQRVVIGKIGDYSIYFDIHSPKVISVDYSKQVLNDYLETDAVIHENYRRAFLAIEPLLPVAKIEVSSIDEQITLTSANSTQHVISTQHPYHKELVDILTKETEIGKIVTSELWYHPTIGHFNGSTGKPLPVLDSVLTSVNPIAEQAIQLFKHKMEQIPEIDEDLDTAPIHVYTNEEELIITPDNQLHHLLLQLKHNLPITVGRCEGHHKVIFTWRSGPMVKSDFRTDRTVFQELEQTHAVNQWLQPHSHIFYDPDRPDIVALISPFEKNKKVQILKPSHPLFSMFRKLAMGYVGIFPLPEGETEMTHTVVYNEEQGLVIDRQSAASLARALDSLHSLHFVLTLENISKPRVANNGLSKSQTRKQLRRLRDAQESEDKRRKTKKEKRRAERNKLPRK
jgi:hypothetical protein